MSAPIVHMAPPEGGIRVINAAQPWGLRNLFSGAVQGAWCDPEAGNTQFQDAALTTPVTAVEQQLGARLDRSGWKNHATQATTTKRPVYSRRVNLFEATLPTGLRNGIGTLIPNAFGAVNGYQLTRQSSSDEVFVPIPLIGLFPGASYTLDMYSAIGASSDTAAFLSLYTSAGNTSCTINHATGVFGAGASTNGFSCSSVSSESVAGGWRTRIKFTIPTSVPAMTFARVYFWAGASLGNPGMVIGNPSLTLAADAHLPYQWVTTATDYDAAPAKFPAYLTANGTSHMLQSATGGGGTTGFYYCAPIRLLKLGAVQVLWSDATGNTGYEVRINASNQLELSAGTGAARVSVASAALVLGRTYILTAMHDGAALSVQVDSGAPVSAACGPIAAGTAGYTLFRAAGTDTGYANVREYGFVYTKNHCPSATHRAMAAQILAAKARITL